MTPKKAGILPQFQQVINPRILYESGQKIGVITLKVSTLSHYIREISKIQHNSEKNDFEYVIILKK